MSYERTTALASTDYLITVHAIRSHQEVDRSSMLRNRATCDLVGPLDLANHTPLGAKHHSYLIIVTAASCYILIIVAAAGCYILIIVTVAGCCIVTRCIANRILFRSAALTSCGGVSFYIKVHV